MSVETRELVVCAFALGQNNFGGGRTRMAELVPVIDCFLPPGSRRAAWHGHSGNIAILTDDAAAVPTALRAASGRDWALIPADMVARALAELGPVRDEDGVRWTPGLAFSLDTGAVVPVVKRDALEGARLDKDKRDGGWGAVSADVARRHGGRWTARSWRPVAGLLRQL